ncbi:plh1 [Symbiodinium natans]|uniref:Plh1 protein n=1 Tax=Symbiodinium natans TaxID=878477 RepID=A0A812PY80_9DINO|nr:plh1 [Symbiodinium natans]
MGIGPAKIESHEDLEEGRRVVVLVHGLASCALQACTEGGETSFLCDHCDSEVEHPRIVFVSIAELLKRPHIMKCLGLKLEEATSRDGLETVSTSCGYTNVDVGPVLGLDGIRTLNPGPESSVTPVYLWHTLIEHLSPNYNCMAFNYDWRRWGDLLYVDELQTQFEQTIERAVRIAGGRPVTLVGHSMGAQVINYMLGVKGPNWTEKHVSDTVLVGPANMGSPSVFAAYANGPSQVAHSTVIPLADIAEVRIRDVASTWPGLLAVMPTRLAGFDVFEAKPLAIRKNVREYHAGDCIPFLEDVQTCEDTDPLGIYDEDQSLHERMRRCLEDLNLVDAKRVWEAGFPLAARMRRGIEQKIMPNLKPPLGCRVHVVYCADVKTLSVMTFHENLLRKAGHAQWEPGDDTIIASSVERMCDLWKEKGVQVRKYRAQKTHHKNLISCKFMMHVIDDVMDMAEGNCETSEMSVDSEETGDSELGWCGVAE